MKNCLYCNAIIYQDNEGIVCYRCKPHKIGVEPEIYVEESHKDGQDDFSDFTFGSYSYRKLKMKQDRFTGLSIGNHNYKKMRQENIDLHSEIDTLLD